MKVNKYQRGQIWWYENCKSFDGSIQGKTRPVILISNNKANENSNNLIGIPCTSQIKRLDLITHVRFKIENTDNIALCENIMSINVNKLTNYVGICDEELMEKIEYSAKIALGFETIPVKQELPSPEFPIPIEEQQGVIYAPYIELKQKPSESTPYVPYKQPDLLVSLEEQKIIENPLHEKPEKIVRRKPKYTFEEMIRFVNDYENHDVNYMISKYKETSTKAVQNKVYRFRKLLNEGDL